MFRVRFCLFRHLSYCEGTLTYDFMIHAGAQCFAYKQAAYILGDGVPKPFLVGFNNNSYTHTCPKCQAYIYKYNGPFSLES